MAGDWLKMRVGLQSHPKVVRILSVIRPHDVQFLTDKFRVIGGLHAVWSVFDTHSEDGILNGYTVETLDHIIGWNGFSRAMVDVGWLVELTGDALQMPDFVEHNGKSAKRRAEDQKRKRESRICPQSVRNLSEDNRTREEKRREEGIYASAKRNKPAAIVKPVGVDESVWQDWLKIRKSKKAPLTETAWNLFINECKKAGWTVDDAVKECCLRNWQSFKAEWVEKERKTSSGILAGAI
jgi:hypothetical protein